MPGFEPVDPLVVGAVLGPRIIVPCQLSSKGKNDFKDLKQ